MTLPMSSHDGPLPRGLILQHESFRRILDCRLLLNAAVTEPVGRVLDIGTGSGIWAAEFATGHPAAEVVGIDVFPQPTIVAPPNCHFMIRDAEKQGDWDFGGGGGDGMFDVIHTRLVPFHAKELPAVLRRCYEHLRPGGYMEMQEVWPPCRTDEPPGAPEHASKVIAWARLRGEAAAKIGIDHSIAGRLPEALSAAGFVDVQTRDLKWPMGPWMVDQGLKEAGDMLLEMSQIGKMDMSRELLSHLGMGEQEIADLVEQVGRELGVGKIYVPVRVVWARKPE